jgi:ArsR family transcriptional regulator, lead/cadmium/zinc/bismuth-responsive transcriptional repressor
LNYCSSIQELEEDFMPIDEQTATRTAELFANLSDPSRVRILSALLEHSELNVGALVELLEMTESAISHQLRSLRQTRVVRARKEGRQVFYRIDDEHVAMLLQQGLEHALHE